MTILDTTHRLGRRLLTFILLLGVSVALVSCDSNGSGETGGGGSGGELSASESRNQIENASSQLSATAKEFTETGEAAQAFNSLFDSGIGGVFGSFSKTHGASSLGDELGDKLSRDVLDPNTSPEGAFDFSGAAAEYKWNESLGQWEKVSSSNELLLRFPSDGSAANTNNSLLTLSEYSETAVTRDGDTEYLPTQLEGNVEVDGETVFAADLSGASYGSVAGFFAPTSITLDVLTKPFGHLFEVKSPSPVDFNFSYELTKNARFLAGLSVNADLNTGLENVEGLGDVDKLTGSLDFSKDLSLAYTIDADRLASVGTSPSAQTLNDRIDATLEYKGSKIGTVELMDTSSGLSAKIVYNDGSSDPITDFVGSVGGGFSLSGVAKSLSASF